MATKRRVQTARPGRSLKCSVCLVESKNTRQLPCDHKFCLQCTKAQFEKLSSVNVSEERVTIVCAYCRDYFLSSIDFLKETSKSRKSERRDYLQRPLSARPVDDGKPQRCQPCREGSHYETAAFWCQDCIEYLCSGCAKYHKSMKMSKMHVLKTIKDKERYGHIKSKVADLMTPKPKSDVSYLHQQMSGYCCDPCNETKKRRDAKYWCENCKEKFCSDCSSCHQSMKMSKGHKIMSMKDVIAKSETKYSLSVECERHVGEILSLFCKRCENSCCAICAITVHEKCGAVLKAKMKSKSVAEIVNARFDEPVKDKESRSVKFDKKGDKSVTIYEKPKDFKDEKPKEVKTEAKKHLIPKNRMENRKSRISYESVTKGDWVISLAVLSTGDILFIELYQNELKMMNNARDIVSTCSFPGDPWCVAVYNDSLAVVSFSDRKQLQLVNITKYGLEAGKVIKTRHKSLAVCFTKDLIIASSWEGSIHVMNIVGNELASIDKDHKGNKLFTNPEYITTDKKGTTVYVSDYKQHTVTALRILPNRIDNKPTWVFKDPDLEGPKGMAVDTHGAIYVSGMSSRNIFRLTPTGEIIQIYRRRDDRDYYEALALSPLNDKLYASAYEDDTIIVFNLSRL